MSARVTGGPVQDTQSFSSWGAWGFPCDTRVGLDNSARNIHQHHALGCPAGSPPALPAAVP